MKTRKTKKHIKFVMKDHWDDFKPRVVKNHLSLAKSIKTKHIATRNPNVTFGNTKSFDWGRNNAEEDNLEDRNVRQGQEAKKKPSFNNFAYYEVINLRYK